MSKVDAIFMGLIYLILGIPLISFSVNMPKVENVSQLVKDIMSERNLESDYKTFLHYPADSVIASDIGIFQKWICQISRMESPSLFKRCEYIKRHKSKPDFSENADKINSLRLACLIVGIVLCFLSLFKFISVLPFFGPLWDGTFSSKKKLNLKHKK